MRIIYNDTVIAGVQAVEVVPVFSEVGVHLYNRITITVKEKT